VTGEQGATGRFVYHAPTKEEAATMQQFRFYLQGLAKSIEDTPMDSRCRALALTKAEECSFWVNKGIVFAPDRDEPKAGE
jgi:hypothetical protein